MNYETFCKDLLNLTKEQITKNELLKLLKKYSSRISVFDLMNLITASDNTSDGFRKWTKLGNKMQVETFIFRMKALDTDFSTYVGNMIIMILKNIYSI